MSSSKKPRKGHALGLVVATVVATTTSMGCSEMHTLPPDASSSSVDAAMAVDDASPPADGGSLADAGSPMDAALALDSGSPDDASFADDAGDLTDAYYPDGIRG